MTDGLLLIGDPQSKLDVSSEMMEVDMQSEVDKSEDCKSEADTSCPSSQAGKFCTVTGVDVLSSSTLNFKGIRSSQTGTWYSY